MQSAALVNYVVVHYFLDMAKATGTPKSFRLTDEELPRFERAVKRHGSVKAAVMAGLAALENQNDISQADVLRWIKERTK